MNKQKSLEKNVNESMIYSETKQNKAKPKRERESERKKNIRDLSQMLFEIHVCISWIRKLIHRRL